MQVVSPEYEESMQSPLRNRGYMRVEIGHISDLQKKAVITGGHTYYSNSSNVFNNGYDNGFKYATLEENYTQVNDSKYFAPSSGSSPSSYRENAFVSDSLIDENNDYELTISFGGDYVTFDTIIFNFGDDYPLTFSLTDSDGNVYSYTNTTGRIVEIHQEFEGVNYIILTVTDMKDHYARRLRIFSISFDYGLEYENDMILDSNLDSNISPIAETLPQTNFMVKLINEDNRFDVENPKSIVNQFTTATTVNIYYGYQLTDTIEWLQAAKLYVDDWEYDKDSFTLYAKDRLQIDNGKFSGGVVGNITLYNLAVRIFTEMGITDYEIDDDLKYVIVSNPLPVVSYKEALQIIANAGCKILFIRRDGSIKIGSDIYYAYTLSSNGTMTYSNVNSIETNDRKYDYATLEKDFTRVNDSKYIFPTSGSNYLQNGYVSQIMSNEDGEFDNTHPMITITSPTLFNTSGMTIVFGDTYATEFTIKWYQENVLTEEETFTNSQKNCSLTWNRISADKIEIVFDKTVNPYNRVRVNYINISPAELEFSFTNMDIMSYPKFTKLEKPQKIVVPYYIYTLTTDEKKITTQTISVSSVTDEIEFNWVTPYSDYRCDNASVQIVKSSAHSITLNFSSTGSKTFTIYGKEYNVVEQDVEEVLSDKGPIVRWENPLISSYAVAGNLLNWLKDFYALSGMYEFDTRGNPELDVNDQATQENYLGNQMNVLVTGLSLGFNGAFSGSVRTLKIGDEE